MPHPVIAQWLIVLAAAAVLAAATPPLDHTAETRAIAAAFIHRQFELGDIGGAKAQFFAPDYIQHNPEIPNGLQGDSKFLEARRQRESDRYLPVAQWTNVNDRLLVQGKYFALHHHLFTSPTDPGRVFFDLWRVENGRIVEHWDIIQPVNDAPLNTNTMWRATFAPATANSPAPAPETVIRDYLRIGLDEHDARRAALLYIDDMFVQHSPHIADGKPALLTYFAAREGAGAAPPRQSSVTHIIADGDLVAVTRHVTRAPGDKGIMYADLFRVQRGRIVEHWDVIQPVPDTSVNGNTMW